MDRDWKKFEFAHSVCLTRSDTFVLVATARRHQCTIRQRSICTPHSPLPGDLINLFALLRSAQLGLKLARFLGPIEKHRPIGYSPSNVQELNNGGSGTRAHGQRITAWDSRRSWA